MLSIERNGRVNVVTSEAERDAERDPTTVNIERQPGTSPRDLAIRFQAATRRADEVARAAPHGRKATAYADVLRSEGFLELDMAEVSRIVGE